MTSILLTERIGADVATAGSLTLLIVTPVILFPEETARAERAASRIGQMLAGTRLLPAGRCGPRKRVAAPASCHLHPSFIGQGWLASAYSLALTATSGSISARSAESSSDTFSNCLPFHSSIH